MPITRELYRSCNVYIPAITIRMMDVIVIMIHDLGRNLICVDKSLIRSQCVVAVVKCLKALATCHESWVSGKPSNRSARGVDIPPTTRNLVFCTRTDVREYIPHSGQEYGHIVTLQAHVLHIGCASGPTVACGGTDPRVGIKGKRLLRNNHWMFQACELGLPLLGLKI
jgi:hypothetical protein